MGKTNARDKGVARKKVQPQCGKEARSSGWLFVQLAVVSVALYLGYSRGYFVNGARQTPFASVGGTVELLGESYANTRSKYEGKPNFTIRHVRFGLVQDMEIRGAESEPWRLSESESSFVDSDGTGHTSIYCLSSLISPAEAAALFDTARGLAYKHDRDTVDNKPTFEADIVRDGHIIDQNMLDAVRPFLETRLLPYVRNRQNCSDCVACTVIVRRYVPGERRQHPWHFDSDAFFTVVVPLSPQAEYEGGLYLQPGFDLKDREYFLLEAGEAVLHDYNLRHGVQVLRGERVSLVVWLKSSAEACTQQSSPWYADAAAHGDRNAQHNLGQIIVTGGKGRLPDLEAGHAWYQKAAEGGHTVAQYNLGIAALHGRGTPTDPNTAVMWWQKAAEKKHPKAMSNLGKAHAGGHGGLQKNSSQGVEWWRKAAEQNVDVAMFLLGNALLNGEGIKENFTEAVEWYRKAAELGHADAKKISLLPL